MKLNWKNLALTITLSLLSFPAMAQNAPPASGPNVATSARTITIHAKKFEFIPAEITLTKGQPVKLELTSDDVEHSLVVPDLGINGIMNKGVVTNVMVTPAQVGDFKGKCGKYCGSGHNKMRFVVHVVN